MNSFRLFGFARSKFQHCLTFLRHYGEDAFLTGTSSQYIEDMYNAWLKDPSSVHASWNAYFKNSQAGLRQAYHSPPNLAPLDDMLTSEFCAHTTPSHLVPVTSAAPHRQTQSDDKTIEDHLAVQAVIRSYQARGHMAAQIDPLGLMHRDTVASKTYNGSSPAEIFRKYKLEDLDKVYTLPQNTFIGGSDKKLSLREILKRLEQAYCQHIGVEFMYIDNLQERRFIRERLETPGIRTQSAEQKRRTLERLTLTFEFENFLSKKWPSEKRFGIEGCDMFIPGVKQILDKSTEYGVEQFFMGIAHRGRLNLLANVFRKPLHKMFNQFVPLEPDEVGSGDVKYHYGSHTELTNSVTQKKFKITLLANPSHLESVNGMVLGRTRAEQVQNGDDQGKKSMAILVHGDAAFCGQGVNYEVLALSYLPNYTTHGAICIILNNQIGFTTDPRFSRSSRYCSDLGRVVNAPILHVNADEPDSVIHACSLAAEYRAKFHKDIIIDLVGYRRYGHNEADEPMYTQPTMYTKIRKLEPVAKKYAEQLVKEKVTTEEEIKAMRTKYLTHCEEEFAKASQETQMFIKDWLDSPWSAFYEGKDPLKVAPTGVPESTLLHIANKFAALPPENLDFVIHKGLMRMLTQRKNLTDQKHADWAIAEAFAIGTLVKEGIPVRLSGEDVERGTFSHRHHVLHHQTVDKVTYEPLSDLFSNQARYTVCNSSLSEYGVLGFEMGYAQANPNSLTLWEAQFGDFFNVAQCIFDQFLSSAETKWVRQNGLVVLLPHGYEGMGSEHSSARPERFLQMCSDDPDVIPPDSPDFAIKQLLDCNWIIANCSTPANIFHILRRQILLPFRKPLILFTGKSLLRHPQCISPYSEMIEGTEFRRVIPDSSEASKEPKNVKKLLLCSGKVYYEILNARKKANREKEVAVSRVEQLSPFPYDLLKVECDKYSEAKVCWAQEEPKNIGYYNYVVDRLHTLLKTRPVHYIGRPSAASPATGFKAQHTKEVALLEKQFMEL